MRLTRCLVILPCLGVTFADADVQADESPAIRKIELLGGKVEREESPPGRPVVAVSFANGSRFRDSFVGLLQDFPDLSAVANAGAPHTNPGLLTRLPPNFAPENQLRIWDSSSGSLLVK
jgi:hypothetical protein